MIYLFFRLGFSQTGRIAQGNANNIIMMSLLNMIVRTYVLDIVQVTTTPLSRLQRRRCHRAGMTRPP